MSFDFEAIVEAAEDVIVVTKAFPIEGPEGPEIVYVNPAFTQLSGYTREEVIGKTPRILQGPGSSRETLNVIRQALEKQEPVSADVVNYTKSGEPYWLSINIIPLRDGAGKVTHFAAIERDITQQKERENHLHALTRLDGLTGLVNRRGLDEVLEQAFEFEHIHPSPFSLLLVDIDYFKQVNDEFGHLAGDKVLRAFSQLVKRFLRSDDVAARFGGDEGCIYLHQANLQQATRTAERIRAAMEKLFIEHEGQSIQVSLSIGVAQKQVGDKTPKDLLQRADQALYQAKSLGRNRVNPSPDSAGNSDIEA